MSSQPPNYCGPHGVRYAIYCQGCVKDWYDSLAPIEQALVDYRGGESVASCKKLVDDLRKLEAA